MQNELRMTFPVYRYHPKENMGGGSSNSLKLSEAPYPVADNWQAWKLKLSGDRLKYLASKDAGTEGLGLFRSWYHLSATKVVPGGILDAAGRHFPIVGYYGATRPRNKIVDFFAGFAEIAGLRYNHKFTFGPPEQLNLDAFKNILIQKMRQSKGFPRPIKDVQNAGSFLEIMMIELGEERAKHFFREYTVPNWFPDDGGPSVDIELPE